MGWSCRRDTWIYEHLEFKGEGGGRTDLAYIGANWLGTFINSQAGNRFGLSELGLSFAPSYHPHVSMYREVPRRNQELSIPLSTYKLLLSFLDLDWIRVTRHLQDSFDEKAPPTSFPYLPSPSPLLSSSSYCIFPPDAQSRTNHKKPTHPLYIHQSTPSNSKPQTFKQARQSPF